MSENSACLLDVVAAANKIDGPIRNALEVVNSAAVDERAEETIVGCGRCGIELSVSTELGPSHTRLMLSNPPSAIDEACPAAGAKRKAGDWVTNMSERWFRTTLLGKPPEEDGQVYPLVSQHGLSVALHDAARRTIMAREAEDRKHPQRNPAEADRLRDMAANTVKVLDLILVRPDGKSWQEEVDERRALLE